MLPPAHRLRRSADFVAVMKSGQRINGRYATLYRQLRTESTPGEPPRVGFVVSKAVGHAPRRNRVKRQLRAIMASHLPEFGPGEFWVVRAHPRAAGASFADLDTDLKKSIARAV